MWEHNLYTVYTPMWIVYSILRWLHYGDLIIALIKLITKYLLLHNVTTDVPRNRLHIAGTIFQFQMSSCNFLNHRKFCAETVEVGELLEALLASRMVNPICVFENYSGNKWISVIWPRLQTCRGFFVTNVLLR
jgi:hypothetical protein